MRRIVEANGPYASRGVYQQTRGVARATSQVYGSLWHYAHAVLQEGTAGWGKHLGEYL